MKTMMTTPASQAWNDQGHPAQNRPLTNECRQKLGNSEFLVGDIVSVHRPPIRDAEYVGTVVGNSSYCQDWIRVKDPLGNVYGWHYHNVCLIDRPHPLRPLH